MNKNIKIIYKLDVENEKTIKWNENTTNKGTKEITINDSISI